MEVRDSKTVILLVTTLIKFDEKVIIYARATPITFSAKIIIWFVAILVNDNREAESNHFDIIFLTMPCIIMTIIINTKLIEVI